MTTRTQIKHAADTLVNFLSGLGTARDKAVNAQYFFTPLSPEQLRSAYRSDWIARKVVDIPAQDATRAWRTWQADKNDIEKLEEVERIFAVRDKVRRALIRGRLFGGGVIIIGVDGVQEEPLEVETIKQGTLRFLHVMSRHEVAPGDLDLDVRSPYYGTPKYYDVTTAEFSARFHASRVVRFVGAEPPDLLQNDGGWGDSILQIVDDAVRACGGVTGGIAALVQEAKLDIIRVPELTKRIVDDSYKNSLTARFMVANQAKSIVNALLLDKDEEWDRKEASFASLPDVLKMYLLIASGAADIPATRMLGQSPAGLSATGESDVRNYYDTVSSMQENIIQPALRMLDDVIAASALGAPMTGSELHYTWAPLWQMTPAEKAEIAGKKAAVFKIDADAGLIPEMALAYSRINQLIEDGTYPGLEQEVEDAEETGESIEERVLAKQEAAEQARQRLAQGGMPGEEDNLPDEEKAADEPPQAQRKPITKDATPRTLYVSRKVLNPEDIIAWLKREKAYDVLKPDPEALHVTIMYSKTPIDWTKIQSTAYGQNERGEMTIPPGGMRAIELFDEGALVLCIASSELQWRHCDLSHCGAESTHEDYVPHITLGYPEDPVWISEGLSRLQAYQGKIVLGPELFQEVRT